jgi:hypothetical protein
MSASSCLVTYATVCWVATPLVSVFSCRKQIGPGQWDLSVAEHLSPGETYLQVNATYMLQSYVSRQMYIASCCTANIGTGSSKRT